MTQLAQQEPAETENKTAVPAPSKSRQLKLLLIVLVVLVVAGAMSIARRVSERKALAAETGKLSVPTVAVIKPSAEPATDELVLPAQLQAYVESPIYARTNGYLLHWYKDIGSRVKKGDLLADIDTPEVDQELSQAKASREQIQAQLELAKISAERWMNLRKTDSVSQQEADQETNAYKQSQANLAAAEANVRRLEQMELFKHIYAPFSGIVTQRNTDIGALINAGSTPGQKGLFQLAQVDPLRVYVSIPQSYFPNIHSGMPAYIQLEEYPGQKFSGKVVRSADAIDPATRTLLTEVDVENHDGKLLPGAYAQVHFAVPVQVVRISVPVNALLFRAEGPRVAVVGADSRIQLRTVTIGRDFGTKLEILTGLDPNDQVVVNPADSLEDGEQVHVRAEGGNRS
jgi:RND family efflux transporter MFP subunit